MASKPQAAINDPLLTDTNTARNYDLIERMFINAEDSSVAPASEVFKGYLILDISRSLARIADALESIAKSKDNGRK